VLEIAGLVVTVVGVLNDLAKTYVDLAKWEETDIEVDDEWLELAIEKGVLTHEVGDYMWVSESRVPTRELRGTAKVVVAVNADRRIKYRIVQGKPHHVSRNILMRKTPGA
jgi:hypothetical protein